MKWMKQWADSREQFETTEADVKKHMTQVYKKDINRVLKDLPTGQKIRNLFAYYWKI